MIYRVFVFSFPTHTVLRRPTMCISSSSSSRHHELYRNCFDQSPTNRTIVLTRKLRFQRSAISVHSRSSLSRFGIDCNPLDATQYRHHDATSEVNPSASSDFFSHRFPTKVRINRRNKAQPVSPPDRQVCPPAQINVFPICLSFFHGTTRGANS